MQENVLLWLDYTAKIMPEKKAIIDEWETLTYHQYHEKSLGVANAIIDTGIGRRNPVVVYLPKSAKVLVSFMGIAYSGNFYSPIDLNMPPERGKKIIDTLKPALVITSRDLKQDFTLYGYTGRYLFFEDIMATGKNSTIQSIQDTIIDVDILYVLFTSGSTGTPKGVCISHRSVIDYIDCIVETFGFDSSDVLGNQAPFYFDNSILDIYTTMKTGGTLYIIPPKFFSQPVLLLNFLKECCINTIFWVPSALIVVSQLGALKKVDLTNVLKRVMFCGEVMPTKHLNIWRSFLPDVVYVNLYGPTEITDACTYYTIERTMQDDELIPIGIPMRNVDVLVLDDNNQLITKPYIKGELCVRGTGLARGYYNNPEKTQEVFIQNPVNSAFRDIIYRTGDLVEYNERNELLYVSRKDFQIKHMGHRIELGEIEAAVSSLPGINRCCCIYDDSKKKIILFIDRAMRKDELCLLLKTKLPIYMLPGKVMYIKEFPINFNGKIDRLKLERMVSNV